MPQYVVGVSGGVDSVVLLDALAHGRLGVWDGRPRGEIIVAHFDHGIREDSRQDAELVASLAEKYGLIYEATREELGAHASEELARQQRYAFLHAVCKKHDARLMTAHHADDVVETVAINLHRGTGWRGLAVLDSPGIARPLLTMTKRDIYTYANERHLVWHEDSTNQDHRYLRNRLRRLLETADSETKEWVRELRECQLTLKRKIDAETARLTEEPPYSRYFFAHIDEPSALELLRAVFLRETGKSPTVPQRRRALHAIKVAQAGTAYDVAQGTRLRFKRAEFVVEQSR